MLFFYDNLGSFKSYVMLEGEGGLQNDSISNKKDWSEVQKNRKN